MWQKQQKPDTNKENVKKSADNGLSSIAPPKNEYFKQFNIMANQSSQAKKHQTMALMMNNRSGATAQCQKKPTDTPLQKQAESKTNHIGLPNTLKTGIENLSGIAMDDVSVHYNSAKPAQLKAHAYAQGRDIYLGAGQEKHLPHEAWHVVQQKQGRVKPTVQMKGMVNINDDVGLEKEADIMGAKALEASTSKQEINPSKQKTNPSKQKTNPSKQKNSLVQQTLPTGTTQLKRIDAQSLAITHIVKLNEEGSLYQRNYMGNEVAEVQPTDVITIETDNPLLSRRGPNQEQDPDGDADHERDVRWENAIAFNARPLPENAYIQAGTYRELMREEDKAVAATPQGGSHGSVVLPYSVAVDRGIYMIDASHRGDMYHLRAAISLKPRPVVIYNCRAENDLSNYLSNVRGAEVHKLPYNPADVNLESLGEGYVYRSTEILSESNATDIIAQNVDRKDEIRESMTTIPEACLAGIDAAVKMVFEGMEGNTALMMYRDSGQTSLVYPELDSGEALPQLSEMMERKKFTPVLCGAPKAIGGFRNIGAYWKALELIPQLAGDQIPEDNSNKFKRDIEAEFMKRAYAARKFNIVVGFRSGALDLFTFLGIPTISISLKNIVGEARHGKFAGRDEWQRTNIQYDVPRSEVTRLMPDRGDAKLFMSPYWKMRGQGEVAKPDSTEAKAPAEFDRSDLTTIDQGLDVGIGKVGGGSGAVKEAQARVGAKIPGVITRENVAFILPPEIAAWRNTRAEEEEVQPHIKKFWEHRMADALRGLDIRLKQERELMPPMERDQFDITVQLEKARLKYSDELQKILATRLEIAAHREDAVKRPKAKAPALKKEKQAKPLSENAQKVFDILNSTKERRVALPDSRDDAAVRALFDMSSKEFFAAYTELSRRGLASHTKEGPFLC